MRGLTINQWLKRLALCIGVIGLFIGPSFAQTQPSNAELPATQGNTNPTAPQPTADPVAAAKPIVAIFPLAGDTPQELRDKVGFSLRAKLDRDEHYEVIDGYTIADVVSALDEPVSLATPLQQVFRLAGSLEAQVAIWGELNQSSQGTLLKLHIANIAQPDSAPRTISQSIIKPTDLRFVSEKILAALPLVGSFKHPSQIAVHNDADAELLWQTNPNLVSNGDFSQSGMWEFIYMGDKRLVGFQTQLPPPESDQAAVVEVDGNRVLALQVSKTAAENNGLAVLSQPIEIKPDTRYRLSFRYLSQGPRLHVFVKGYTLFEDINGQKTQREVYRRQVPPSGDTHGQWVTVVNELNPQHVTLPVQTLRIDLYVYFQSGLVLFDDVILKAIGQPTHRADDAALDLPVTRPAETP
ncbi:MAG: hypothetical protein IT448_05865 [Phycisphaerales bacterium]|nr:hypothetical protein [Phycisphaerales bacterium]